MPQAAASSPGVAGKPIVGALLLGAGFGRRFGTDKRLHPLGNFQCCHHNRGQICRGFRSRAGGRETPRPDNRENTL